MAAAGVTVSGNALAILLFEKMNEAISTSSFSSASSLCEALGEMGITLAEELATELFAEGKILSKRGMKLAAPGSPVAPAAPAFVAAPTASPSRGGASVSMYDRVIAAAGKADFNVVGVVGPAYNPLTKKFTKGARPTTGQKLWVSERCWEGTTVPFRFVFNPSEILPADLAAIEAAFGKLTETVKVASTKSAPASFVAAAASPLVAAPVAAEYKFPFEAAKEVMSRPTNAGKCYNAVTGLANGLKPAEFMRQGWLLRVPGLDFIVFVRQSGGGISSEGVAKGQQAYRWLMEHGAAVGTIDKAMNLVFAAATPAPAASGSGGSAAMEEVTDEEDLTEM